MYVHFYSVIAKYEQMIIVSSFSDRTIEMDIHSVVYFTNFNQMC